MKKLMKGLLSIALMLSVVACSSADNLQLEVTEITVEYGDPLSLDPKDYLAEDTSEDILNEVTAEVFVVEDDQKAEDPIDTDGSDLEVGNYVLSLSYNEEVEDVKVTVSDTTAPEFVDFTDRVIFIQGESTDLTQLFKTEDKSPVEVTVEGNVDFNTVGEYSVKFIATDEYENTTEKDCVIQIDEKPKEITPVKDTSGNSGSNSSSSSSNTSSNSNSSTGSNNSGSSGNSSSGSSNTSGNSSSSGGSTTTQPSQPTAHTHVWVDDWGQPNTSGLIYDTWDEAANKCDEIGFSGTMEYGDWTNIGVDRVHCSICEEQGVWLEKWQIFFKY